MGETTKIEWANATWNPWIGCKKVSAGCKNCYMFREMTFYGRDPNVVVRTSPRTFRAPLRWAKSGKVTPGSRIFTCSWSDWFIDKADDWRDEAWDIIRATPQFSYLILTKRPERIADHLPKDWGDIGWPNVWIGVSAEDQVNADRRVPILQAIPAVVRFVSAEPLLGPIDTTMWWGIDWVITGGESDRQHPRLCDLDWVRAIRDTCELFEVALFHKQNGGKTKIDGVWGGRVLDGRTHDDFPIPIGQEA